MPIVWKLTFEEPLIKQIQSGQISNSKKMVDAIALFYDASIRQGLPNPPATAGGPLINGNILGFKKILGTYFKLETVKQQAIVVKIYSKVVKDILQNIKSISKEISKNRKQVKSIAREQLTINREIRRLRNTRTLEASRRIAELTSKNQKLLAEKINIISSITAKQEYITDVIRPKISELKDQLRDLIKKFAMPILQPSKLALIKSLPKLIKQNISEIKNKKKQYLDTIKSNVKKINEANQQFKKLRGSLTKEDSAKIKTSINSLIKSTNVSTLIKAGDMIAAVISKYPDSKINPELKNTCRSNINKIIQLKLEIVTIKQTAKETLKEKIKERKDDLIASIKPKIGPGLSKIQEMRVRTKELKSFISQYKQVVTRFNDSRKIVTKVKSEYSKIRKTPDNIKYIPNAGLAPILDAQQSGLGSKYLQINSTRAAKAFLIGAITSAISSNEQLNELKSKYKNNILEIRNKIISQRINPKELIFNSFLRMAVMSYWTGGTMSNVGLPTTVLNPGIVSLPVSMKASSNPANFVRSLSKTLQLHTLTVSGIHVIPGTPPVTLPWVGYK